MHFLLLVNIIKIAVRYKIDIYKHQLRVKWVVFKILIIIRHIWNYVCLSCSKTIQCESLVSSLQHDANPFQIHQTSILVSIYVPKLGSAPGFILVCEMGWNLCRTWELGGATSLVLVCCKVNFSTKNQVP